MRASALVVWAALQYHGRWLLWLQRDRENARYPFFPAAVVVVIDLQTDDDDDYYDGEQVERKWIVTSTSIGAHCHCYCKEKRTI